MQAPIIAPSSARLAKSNSKPFGPRLRAAPRARAVSVMAKLNVYVKGDPKTNTLLDCPFCHRVLLTLETKGAPYDVSYVDFDDKPKWLVDEFEGKVPVIQDGDTKMATAPEAAGKILPAFRGWLMASPAEETEKKAAFLAALDALDAALAAAPGPLFGGERMDSTDAALAPKLYHALTALKHWKGFNIYALPADKYPAIKKYRLALAELEAWKKVDYGTEAIIKGWERHMKGH
ncbi:dehydroascorbate reductase [Raphidocelis subcapitata]|uniref:Dehydroascorbate reductase n=1 Tax=Raphidocelis subcapitata TaxID=307507 RepID=A0A2V0PE81_9CHLO|nr:dehydroascorbate reductase [Raphidocelis subcapitata]|eukprot:GBF96200.1 dehydroascorbate reductase [Raphidocelis subcapitata]